MSPIRMHPNRLSSTELSGPHNPSSIPSTSQPWAGSDKGKGKMPEYEVDHHDESDSDVSARSLDSEFGVPIMETLVLRIDRPQLTYTYTNMAAEIENDKKNKQEKNTSTKDTILTWKT